MAWLVRKLVNRMIARRWKKALKQRSDIEWSRQLEEWNQHNRDTGHW